MKRLLAGSVLAALAALLSGCYVAPDYSYVRAGPYAGPAYYGHAVVRDDGYVVAPAWYGGGWYGCCYSPGVTVGGVWYRGDWRYRQGYRGHDWRHDGRGHDRRGDYRHGDDHRH